MNRGIQALTLGIACVALFVAAGGPSYAAKKATQISGKSIKKNSISADRLTSAARSSLKGDTGSRGQQGGQGSQGPAGPAFKVRDASGGVVGTLIGTSNLTYTVREGGANWEWLYSGELVSNFTPMYLTSGCTGAAYYRPNGYATANSINHPNWRGVYRPENAGVLGTAQAWRGGGTETVSGQAMYYLNQAGGCSSVGAFTGTLVLLTAVAPPTDRPGPLTLDGL